MSDFKCTYACPFPRIIIPTSFEDCLTYGQRQAYMWSVIEDIDRRLQELEENQNTSSNSIGD